MGRNRRPDIRAKTTTRKRIGRLTYSPVKNKQKHKQSLRKQLLARDPIVEPQILPPSPLLTFGSLNVNGLDTEAHWAVSELVRDRNIDVRLKLEMVYISYVIIRFLLSARLLEDPTSHGPSQAFQGILRGGQRGQ